MRTTTTRQAHTRTAATNPTTTAPAGAGTTCAGWTVFEGPAGPADADTHEGLRVALGVIEREGWAGPAGRAVLAALRGRCASWAAQRAVASGVARGSVDAGEVLSLGWLTLARFGSRVGAAEAPWAYLWTSVQNAMAVEIAAAEVLSRTAVERTSEEWPRTALRYGLALFGELEREDSDDDPDSDRRVRARHVLAALAAAARRQESRAGLSRAAAALIVHLARGREAEREFWTEVVTHALEVMDGARRSYEEVTLRADPYLVHVLGLSPQELSALAALLIGPRRGDRAGQCLLLALHRDPTTDPADVPGAVARIGVLTARRPGTMRRLAVAA